MPVSSVFALKSSARRLPMPDSGSTAVRTAFWANRHPRPATLPKQPSPTSRNNSIITEHFPVAEGLPRDNKENHPQPENHPRSVGRRGSRPLSQREAISGDRQ